MRRSVVALICGLAIGLLGLVAPFSAPASAAAADAEGEFLQLVNSERAAAGLGSLSVRPELVGVARDWTAGMIGAGALSHNSSLGDVMPSDWVRFGENVGYGSTVGKVHSAFMNSTGHRANILGDYNQVAIGSERDGNGQVWVTVVFLKAASVRELVTSATNGTGTGATGCAASANPAPPANRNGATGYYVLGSDGGIFNYGNAPYKGSVPELGLRIDAVLMTLTPSQEGYWIAGRDGGIFSFGDAVFRGSVPGLGLGVPVTAIDLKPTPSGNGYWILGADGGIFSFGDAQFFGSVPGIGVRATGISMARSDSGDGYWILGSDGGIFSFGDAGFYGSVPGIGLCERVTGVQLSRTVKGAGYYIVSDTGRVFAFGDAAFLGEPVGNNMVARDVQAVAK